MSKEQAQQALQDALVTNYFSNLKFLRDAEPNLYERVNHLSNFIDQGVYEERYTLEFLEDEGEFDIYDKKLDFYFYNKKPKKYISQAVAISNFDQKGYFSLLEKELYKNVTFENLDYTKLQEAEESLQLLYNDMNKYVEIMKDDTTKKKNFKNIDKFIFLGTLLGRHIPRMVNKLKSKVYFIHEPNLEIFRLSLFVLDYTVLLSHDAHVIFSVMDDDTTFEKQLYKFMSLNSWSNHTIKYHTTNFNVKQSFDNVMNAIMSFKPTIFNYYMKQYCIIRNISERMNCYKQLSFPLKKSEDIFQGKPVLYICPGPSLGDNVEWVKDNQDKFVIVTVGAAVKKLLALNIKPSIIVTLDAKYHDLDQLQFDKETCEKIQDVIVFASMMTDQRILDRFNQDNLYLYEVLTSFKTKNAPLSGYSVGEIGYRILLELGVQNLYLLGTDLAVDQKKGTTHSVEGSGNSEEYDLESHDHDNVTKGTFGLKDDLIQVKGNLQEKVYSNRNFNNSINFYHKVGVEINTDIQTVYNLSNHGAFFENTQPLIISDVELGEPFNREENFSLLEKKLKEIYTIGLDVEEKGAVNLSINQLNKFKQLLEEKSVKDYNSYSELKEDMIIINNEVMGYRVYFSEVMSNYLSIINTYLDYCFNDTKCKNEVKKVKKVKELWFKEMNKFLDDHIKYLEQLVGK